MRGYALVVVMMMIRQEASKAIFVALVGLGRVQERMQEVALRGVLYI